MIDDVGTGTVSVALAESEVRITAKRSSATRIRTVTPADHTTAFSFSHFCSSSLGTAECYDERCSISLAGASRQAGILREAGLITTRRAGQAVRHDLTTLGRMILDGCGTPIG